MNSQFTQEDEAALRDSLKRCSPATIEKAVEFRKTGNPELVGDVVIGIIERFVEPDKRDALKSAIAAVRAEISGLTAAPSVAT
jgi:3-hydroxyacyl-[acyl-carrier-protein] dehydratase